MKINFLIMLACVIALAGCSESQNHSRKSSGGHKHDQPPPHGGTVVPVGKHQYALELVQDFESGKLNAFVLEAHMKFVPVPEKSFEIVVRKNDQEERLVFQRASAPGSTELSQKSSQFETSAEWLKDVVQFEGVIPEITLNGKTFTNIAFTFPVNTIDRL